MLLMPLGLLALEDRASVLGRGRDLLALMRSAVLPTSGACTIACSRAVSVMKGSVSRGSGPGEFSAAAALAALASASWPLALWSRRCFSVISPVIML